MHYATLGEIWNKFEGFHYLLELNDDACNHEAYQSDFEGTYYKLKPGMERLLPSQETGSMLVIPKLDASSSLDNTCSDPNQSHSHRGYCHQYLCLCLMEN